MNLFQIDGPLYTFGTYVYKLFLLNSLWILFSLPLVTVGASTTALFSVSRKIVQGQQSNIVISFCHSFVTEFWPSTRVLLLQLLAVWVLSVNLRHLHLYGRVITFGLALQMLAAIQLVFASIYIYPLLAWYEMPFRELWKAAFLLGNRHLPTTITLLGFFGLLLWLVSYGWLWLILFMIGLYSVITTYLLQRPIGDINTRMSPEIEFRK